MYPHERSLVQKMEGRPFALIGINSDEDREALKKVIQKESLAWRSFWDVNTSGPIATSWNINGWPTIYVLDHKGVIRSINPQDMDKTIEELVVEAEKAKKT